MKAASLEIRKSVLFLLTGAVIVLCIVTGFLYSVKRVVQEENRMLIIQNDSIMSANIVLKDSLRQKLPGTPVKPVTKQY